MLCSRRRVKAAGNAGVAFIFNVVVGGEVKLSTTGALWVVAFAEYVAPMFTRYNTPKGNILERYPTLRARVQRMVDRPQSKLLSRSEIG